MHIVDVEEFDKIYVSHAREARAPTYLVARKAAKSGMLYVIVGPNEHAGLTVANSPKDALAKWTIEGASDQWSAARVRLVVALPGVREEALRMARLAAASIGTETAARVLAAAEAHDPLASGARVRPWFLREAVALRKLARGSTAETDAGCFVRAVAALTETTFDAALARLREAP